MQWTKNQRVILTNSTLWSSYDYLTTAFLPVFILAIGANNVWVGLFSSIPYFAMMLAQIPGAFSIQLLPRKVIYLATTGVSRLFWIGVVISPALYGAKSIYYAALFYFVCKLLEYLADSAWTTMLADVVPTAIRGTFIGHRMVLMGLAGTVAYLIGGYLLDLFPKGDLWGFYIVFLVGMGIGLLSTLSYTRFDEPTKHEHEHYHMKEFFTMKGDFAKFNLFIFWFYFAYMIVGPFFTVYMLKNLGISNTFFVVTTGVSTIARLLSQQYIGRLSDKVGDKMIMMFVCVATAIVPFTFYFITPANLWLLIPVHIFSGVAWAGFDIAILNLLLDFSDGKKQPVRIAEMQMVTSLAIVISPIVGGYLADHAIFAMGAIPFLFLLGSGMRLASVFFLLPIPEPRVKAHKTPTDVFRDNVGAHPIEGAIHVTRNIHKRLKAFMLP